MGPFRQIIIVWLFPTTTLMDLWRHGRVLKSTFILRKSTRDRTKLLFLKSSLPSAFYTNKGMVYYNVRITRKHFRFTKKHRKSVKKLFLQTILLWLFLTTTWVRCIKTWKITRKQLCWRESTRNSTKLSFSKSYRSRSDIQQCRCSVWQNERVFKRIIIFWTRSEYFLKFIIFESCEH